MDPITFLFGLASGGAQVYEAYDQAEKIRQQGMFQARMYEFNQKVAEVQARDSIRRGDIEARHLGYKGNQLVGSQRASLAAQGIDVNSGDAMAIQQEAAQNIARDKSRIKANAFREAWGHKVNALNYNLKTQFEIMSTNNQASSTITSGWMNGLTSFGKGVAGYGAGG